MSMRRSSGAPDFKKGSSSNFCCKNLENGSGSGQIARLRSLAVYFEEITKIERILLYLMEIQLIFIFWWSCNGQHWLVLFLWKKEKKNFKSSPSSTPLYHYSEFLRLFEKKQNIFAKFRALNWYWGEIMVQRCGGGTRSEVLLFFFS